MKTIVKDVLFGLLIIILITAAEFIVTLPFDVSPDLSNAELVPVLNREFLLTAVPAGIITYFFAEFVKTTTKGEAIRRSLLWTAMVVLNYLAMALGNDRLGVIFGAWGLYVLFLFTLLGPLIFARVMKLL